MALAVTAVYLLSAAPVHASAEAVDLNDIWPGIGEEVSYLVDFVDWDGDILDSRICTYGEKLGDIIVPGEREEGGCVYRFTGWDPEVSEIVTESMAYMAVYQRIDGSDDEDTDAGTVPEPETGEMAGTIGRAASADARCSGEVQQVSSTSYDVTPFHIESFIEKGDLPDGWADDPEDGLADGPENDPAGDPVDGLSAVSLPEAGTFRSIGIGEIGRGVKLDMAKISENVQNIRSVDLPGADMDMPETMEKTDLSGISAAAVDITEMDMPAIRSKAENKKAGTFSVKTAKKISAAGMAGHGVKAADLVSRKRFPLLWLLCSMAAAVGGVWIMKGVWQAYGLFRERR